MPEVVMQAPKQLVEQACAGNAAAISQLLVVCQPDLKRFARRTCSTTEHAEDALQVALWQIHRRIGALRAVAAFATWLFRIVERECFRLFRGRQPAASVEESDSPRENDGARAHGELRLLQFHRQVEYWGGIGMYCSTTIRWHLARGAGAMALIALMFQCGGAFPILILVSILGALLLLGGCPSCWIVGLVERLPSRRRSLLPGAREGES